MTGNYKQYLPHQKIWGVFIIEEIKGGEAKVKSLYPHKGQMKLTRYDYPVEKLQKMIDAGEIVKASEAEIIAMSALIEIQN